MDADVADTLGQELEALFPFDGGGLEITGAALGRRIEFECDGKRVTIALPGPEHVWRVSDPRRSLPDERWKRARLTHGFAERDEVAAASVERFEVRVRVEPDSDLPASELIRDAFPLAATAAERFLGSIRTGAHQYWLPAQHEGISLADTAQLVVAGTYNEVSREARLQPGHMAIGVSLDNAAKPSDVDEAFQNTKAGVDPPVVDTLLADARMALSAFAIKHWNGRDTTRAVLLAAIAAEVRIKRVLVENASEVLDSALENPRELSVAVGQLLNRPMKAAVGASLLDDDKPLYDEVAEKPGVFWLRNQVAHRAYQPTLPEAQQAVGSVERLFVWLDGVAGPGAGRQPPPRRP